MRYIEKLRDPRWQKKRLEVLERDGWICQQCFDGKSTLNVHHRYYNTDAEPWDYPLEALLTLCEDCHSLEKEQRPQAERSLIGALKRFDLARIKDLAESFQNCRLIHDPSVVTSVLNMILTVPDAQEQAIREYFEFLKTHKSDTE